jgi:hypothetical protein
MIFQGAQVLDEIADGEICGIALAVIAEFPAKGKGLHVWIGQHLAAIPVGTEDGLDEALVLPGKTAEEDRDLVSLFGHEGPLDGASKVSALVERRSIFDQPLPLRGHAFHRLWSQGLSRASEAAIESHELRTSGQGEPSFLCRAKAQSLALQV